MAGDINKKPAFADEISLEEFLLSLAESFKWAKRHFKYLVLFGIIGGTLSVLWAIRKETTYTAVLTFILSDNNNPRVSNSSGILSQLGLTLPTGSYNVEKLLKIGRSRRILASALFEKTVINQKNDYLANHFIDIYKLNISWNGSNIDFNDFTFKHSNLDSFDLKENSALLKLYNLIIGQDDNNSNALFTSDYSMGDYFMSFKTKSLSDKLSIAFTNEMFDQISEFYIATSIENDQSVFDLIKYRRDSLANVVQKNTYEIAQLKDKSKGSFRVSNNVDIANKEGLLLGLETALKEVEKSLNAADFALKTNTPLIQVIDRPIAPLKLNKPSLTKYGVFGIFVGIFLFLLLQFFVKVVKLSQVE